MDTTSPVFDEPLADETANGSFEPLENIPTLDRISEDIQSLINHPEVFSSLKEKSTLKKISEQLQSQRKAHGHLEPSAPGPESFIRRSKRPEIFRILREKSTLRKISEQIQAKKKPFAPKESNYEIATLKTIAN
jgi:hypothetical protein